MGTSTNSAASSGANPSTAESDPPTNDEIGASSPGKAEDGHATSEPPASNREGFITNALNEADLLIAYAASSGITIDPNVSAAIASAREALRGQNWNWEIEARFWPAKSKLSLGVKPVTAERLAAGRLGAAAKATKKYFIWTLILTVALVPISIVMFINTRISNYMETLLKENNAAEFTLRRQLVSYQSALERASPNTAERATQNRSDVNFGASQAVLAPELVENLTEFVHVSRQIFAEASVLNRFILWFAQKPPEWLGTCKPGTADGKPALELTGAGGTLGTADDKPATVRDIACQETNQRENLELDVRAGDLDVQAGEPDHPSITDRGFEKLATYQIIRSFAQQAEQMNTVIFGALTAYLLPVFYSLLGACAFGLRNTIPQTGNKTYQPPYFDWTRLIIASIAGTVVGLFNNFTQGVSASPLAIAFLVGYAVEIFFSFLDALVHTFAGLRNTKALGETGSA